MVVIQSTLEMGVDEVDGDDQSVAEQDERNDLGGHG
jgi:hypothetical protein